MRGHNIDFKSGLQRDWRCGFGRREEFVLRFLDEGCQLIGAVGESGAWEPSQNNELQAFSVHGIL